MHSSPNNPTACFAFQFKSLTLQRTAFVSWRRWNPESFLAGGIPGANVADYLPPPWPKVMSD